uniref:Uncharacterized protein n=1 Tax=Rhizophora mucronata TaxID=61149 RepID=A0A2P2QK98_RHIMU
MMKSISSTGSPSRKM